MGRKCIVTQRRRFSMGRVATIGTLAASIIAIAGCDSNEYETIHEAKPAKYWEDRNRGTELGPHGIQCAEGTTKSLTLSPSVSSAASGMNIDGWGTNHLTIIPKDIGREAVNVIAGDETSGDTRQGLLGRQLHLTGTLELSVEDFNRGQLDMTKIRKIDWITLCFAD